MSNKRTYQYDLSDSMAHGDFEDIAERNAESFYELKRDLVQKRKSLCSIEQIAKQLGEQVATVAEFEQYYSDPTVSQLQEYALAVMCVIKIKAVDFEPDKSSMYKIANSHVDSAESIGVVLGTKESVLDTHNIHRETMTICLQTHSR